MVSLLLREVAQCPEEDIDEFQNIEKHSYFNTNSLWIRLDALKDLLEKENGVLPLPMIQNKKTVDPRDSQSTRSISLKRQWVLPSSRSQAQRLFVCRGRVLRR